MSEAGTRSYVVSGYRRIKVRMRVTAETADEAIYKAKAGDYRDVDTEPDCDLDRPKWTAEKANG